MGIEYLKYFHYQELLNFICHFLKATKYSLPAISNKIEVSIWREGEMVLVFRSWENNTWDYRVSASIKLVENTGPDNKAIHGHLQR